MFGIRLVIGAADKTTGAMRGVESRLKKFSRGIKQALSLGGMVVVFQKLFSMIDKGFSTSTYAKEWDSFKSKMSNGFADLVGRIADTWGPMMVQVSAWTEKLFEAFNKIVSKVQWIGAALGAIFSGSSFTDASKIADDTVKALASERVARKEQQSRVPEEPQDYSKEARGSIVGWRDREARNMKERAAARRRRAEQSAGNIRAFGDYGPLFPGAQTLGRSEELGGTLRTGHGETLFTSGFKRSTDYFGASMGAMSADELQELASGPLSKIKAAARSAKKSARDGRKWQRLVGEARRREARGGRVSKRMQAVLASEDVRDAEKKAAADAAAVKQAQIETAANTKAMKEEMTKSTTGGVK